jgi:hypothetical protein
LVICLIMYLFDTRASVLIINHDQLFNHQPSFTKYGTILMHTCHDHLLDICSCTRHTHCVLGMRDIGVGIGTSGSGSGHRDIRTSRHRDIGVGISGISGYRDIGISGHRDIGISGYRDFGISGYRDIGIVTHMITNTSIRSHMLPSKLV